MKTIAVISTSTVPFQLDQNNLSKLTQEEQEEVRHLYSYANASGIRSWNIALQLSQQKDFGVTLFVPDLYYNKEFVYTRQLPFSIQTYSLKAARGLWSEELDRKLKKFNVVILPTHNLVGMLNGAVLPYDINLIVDGWNFIPSEEPCNLLGFSRVYKKIAWDRFIQQHVPLLKRANCVLYALDSQRFGYEGQFFMIEKLDWKAFQFSTLLKVPFGVDKTTTVTRKPLGSSSALNLVWLGEIKPWYYPEFLFSLDQKDLSSVYITFLHAFSPNNKKIFTNYFSKYFESIEGNKNFFIDNRYVTSLPETLSEFDASIVLTKPWIINNYALYVRILTLISYGIPVICNAGLQCVKEFKFYAKDYIIETTYDDLPLVFNNLKNNKHVLNGDEKQIHFLQQSYAWEQVTKPLVSYISSF